MSPMSDGDDVPYWFVGRESSLSVKLCLVYRVIIVSAHGRGACVTERRQRCVSPGGCRSAPSQGVSVPPPTGAVPRCACGALAMPHADELWLL